MKKEKLKSRHCVQCGEILAVFKSGYDDNNKALVRELVCAKPECPNYGLVQKGIETMAAFLKLTTEPPYKPTHE